MATTPESALPEIDDAVVDRIEQRIFEQIAVERGARTSASPHSRRRRRRAWLTGLAAAAVVVVGAAAVPQLVHLGSESASSMSDAPSEFANDGFVTGVADGGAPLLSSGAKEFTLDSAGGDVALQTAPAPGSAADPDIARSIITTANASVTVTDVQAASDAVAQAAGEAGGFVESMNIGTDAYPASGEDAATTLPNRGWITVRIPSEEMTSVVAGLASVGTVTDTSISRQDVTAQVVDLQARVDATRTSVARLTELMAQAGSLADLLQAESTLSERQATLESYEQQLKALSEQVSFSTLSVSLTLASTTVAANPAGFGDGLLAGWNGLVATLNGLVIGFGFLLPWLVVAAVAGGIVLLVVRRVRRRRAPAAD